MTFILAWKDKKNVFVTGDAAVTRRGVSDNYIDDIINGGKLTTAFGESISIRKGQVIQESVLKIHNLNNRFILGYAGTGDIAIDVINDLEQDINLNEKNIVSKIKDATERYGSEFQMVIGFRNKNSAVLLSFNLFGKRKVRYHERNKPIRLGNLRSDDLMKFVSDEIAIMFTTIAQNVTPNKKLVMASVFMQGVILRAGLIAQGVGGFFTGGFVNRDGFFWQKDTCVIKFHLRNGAKPNTRDPAQLFSGPRLIALIIRESKLAILSFDLNRNYRDVTIFHNYISRYKIRYDYAELEQNFNIWKDQYQGEIADILQNFLFDFLVFFCPDRDAPNKMTFLEKESIISERYFKIRWENNIPVLNIPGPFVDEFNPLKAEYLNQFHWMPKE